MNDHRRSNFKKRAAALAVASCMSLAPLFAEAAGLGKLTVYSALGQPLRAEVEISASPDELAGMTARLAPHDVFRQAGIDYASALLDLRFAVEKRGGRSIIKLSSARPVNEPFLDFLVELNWPAGRLVREYTFLLDPPEFSAGKSGGNVADAKLVETVRGGAAPDLRKAPPAVPAARPAPAAKPAQAPAARSKSADGERLVVPGDTLRKIASEQQQQYEGVSLEQMLVGLYRANRNAFIGDDINRLKAGAILKIPTRDEAAAVPASDARQVYVATGDFSGYRRKLAAAAEQAPAREAPEAARASAGKITPKIEEKLPSTDTSRDQVKVARTDVPGKAAADAAAEADRVARDKALKDAEERLALLEKNVGELQKLLELKNQQLAELGKAAAVAPAAPAAPEKPATEPPAADKPVEKAVEAPVKPPVAAEPPPVTPPAKPAAPQPKPVAPPPPPPVEEPGVLDALLEDPLPLAGGAGVLALLAGLLLYRRRRGQDTGALTTTAAPSPSSLGPNSVFRMTGGQSVDTGNTPPQTGEFSQAGPGTIDTDEVDPVAEADVYMAYGRDAQAEEILLEAMQKDPQRLAIHAKLLEIYANRRSLKQFETLAGELYAQSAGVGPEWEKVAALGAELDPENPLYSGGQSAAAAPRREQSPEATLVAVPVAAYAAVAMEEAISDEADTVDEMPMPESRPGDFEFERDTIVLAEQKPEVPAEASEPEAAAVTEEAAADEQIGSLDFDLGVAEVDLPEPPAVEPVDEPLASLEPTPDAGNDVDALDFDLSSLVGGDTPVAADEVPPVHFEMPEEIPADLPDIDVVSEAAPIELTDVAEAMASTQVSQALPDFDLPDMPVADMDNLPDFSPEGTLVMPGALNDAVAGDFEFGEALATPASDEPAEEVLEAPQELQPVAEPESSAGLETVVNSSMGLADLQMDMEEASTIPEMADELTSTVVNMPLGNDDEMDFDVKLSDSVFLGQPMMANEFDISSINLDLGAMPESPAEPVVPAAAQDAPGADAVADVAPQQSPVVHDAQWEEVNTKLDLARAYEEMGDLEGARELLQEVLGEGDEELVAQAQALLERIGG